MPPLALFLVHACLVIGLPFALWRVGAVRRWLPLVVIQIAVGLALGPSGLGQLAPGLYAAAFPPAALAALDGLVWLGLVYFAFATGLHFDLTDIKGRGGAFAVNALSTVAVPTTVGCLVGVALLAYAPEAMGAGAPPWAFAFGIGIAIGVTALPVLAAVLREIGLTGTKLGSEALGCAAINDAGLWVMMAGLLAVAQGGPLWRAAVLMAAALAFAAFLWLVVQPLLPRLFAHVEANGRVGERDVVALSVALFAAALITEMLGLHAVVGAFAFGAIVPKPLASRVLAKFESFLMVVLLPFFFISTGLKTQIHAGHGIWLVFAIATLASLAAKLVSAALPARAEGWAWRDALALGALVSCKGLMELVVLTLLLERGIISPAGFTGMVLMALVTTAIARPLAGVFLRR
ncbi:MAG TPA: cation:proton antiporter [Magnetospirillum sp.]|nr:cation:proton antiporter [Magnetospirillum sp.]